MSSNTIPLGDLKLDVELLTQAIEAAPASERANLIGLITELKRRQERELAQTNFLAFVKAVWPTFIYGRHHARMAQEFEKVVDGDNKRLIINLGPRHSKSELSSYLLPAWFLGKYPEKKVIQCSHTAELAVGFGRKVRNLVGSPAYQEIFPGVELQMDSKAAGRWNTSAGGSYFAIGVSGAVTGLGADILIIDDPHSEQEAAIAATNPEVYDKVYEWFTSGPRQRLQPGGAIILVQCMTGDTKVLMANAVEKPLKDIKVGDKVATYDKGNLSVSQVNNVRSNGIDLIYKIQTQSGIILRANERHPFLVDINGEKQWIRLKDLRPGMALVALKGAIDAPAQKSQALAHRVIKNKPTNRGTPSKVLGFALLKDVIDLQDQKLNPVYVARAKQIKAITKETLTRHIEKLGITENGKVKYALKKAVKSLFIVMGYVTTIMLKSIGHLVKEGGQRKGIEPNTLKQGMVLLWTGIIRCCKTNKVNVQCVVNFPEKMLELTGVENCVLTTATVQGECGGSFVTTAISLLGMVKRKLHYSKPQNTSEFTLDVIESITPDGSEEVFDVEIDRTENFIANGVVSHNTRWSLRDLTGQVRQKELEGGGDVWRSVELPAILPSGQPLWPEFWSLKELEATRNAISVSKWQAQYQQDPTSEEGALIKREWWQRWNNTNPPATDFVMQGWDTAFEKHNRADYSACITWGIFYHPDETGVSQANIIMLDAKRDRLEFPELKQQVLDEYKYWEPDCLLIEKKASGAPLIYELRAMGIAVSDFTPTRGNDKISRMNAVTDIFASGRVWAPNTRWADEVIEEVAAFPAGQHDDFCFVAGTKILMGDGSTKNIEDVCIGDKVWSHLGVKNVLASGCTGTYTTTSISDGINTLEGTASHLIYTDKGWKKLTEINRDDNILTVSTNKDLQCQQNKQEQIEQLSNSTTKLTKNTATDLIMSALVVGIFFIEMCGLFTMGKSQLTTISIILMVILQITLLQIYNVCPRKSIVWSIEKIKVLGVKAKNLWSTLLKLDPSQSHGTNPKKVGHGIGSMLKSFFAVKTGLLHIVKLYRWKKFALFVTNHSFQKTQPHKNTVQINVHKERCDFVIKLISQLFTLIKNVSIVTKTFTPSIVIKDFAIAYAKMVSIEPNVKMKPVYNITVEGAETYYANNILVHNCDVVSMCIARFRKGGFISTTLDKQDEPEEFRGRSYGRSAYY